MAEPATKFEENIDQATGAELEQLSQVQDEDIGPAAREEQSRRPTPPRPKITFMNQQSSVQFPLEAAGPDFSMKAPVIGEAITGLPMETNEEFDLALDLMLDEAEAREQAAHDEATLQVLRDPSLEPDEKIERAQSMPTVARPTVGEVVADEMLLTGLARQITADEIDIKVLRETNQGAQMAMLGEDTDQTFDQFLDKDRPETAPLRDELLAKLLFREEITQEEFDTFMREGPSDYRELHAFVQRMLLFSDPRPVQGAESVEWLKVWQELVDMDGDFVSDQFVSAMEDQYGELWAYRWGAFFAREVGVDAAALWYASTVRGVRNLAFPSAQAHLSRRAVGVGLRAAIVTTAGTSAEGAIQTAIGHGETFDVTSEAFYRLAGELLGESLIKTAKSLGPFGLMIGQLAGETKAVRSIQNVSRKHLTASELSRIQRSMEYESPVMRTYILASIRGEAAEYKRLARQVVDGVADPAILSTKRAQLAEVTGIPARQLEIWLALSPSIFDERVLRAIGGDELANLSNIDNIGRSAEYYELKAGIETNTKLLANLREQKAAVQEQIDDILTTPLDLGEAGAQRLKVLKSERKKINDDIIELNRTTREAEATITELDKAPRTTGNQLADKILVGEAIGFRLIGDVTSRQHAVRDLTVAYIAKDGGFQFRPPDRVVGDLTLSQRFRQALNLSEPDTYPNPGIMKDYFDNFNVGRQMNKEWERVIKTAYRGLGQGGQNRVNNALEMGNNSERVWSVDELIAQGLKPNEIDSYYAVRQALDTAHVVNNQVMVARYKAQGVKVYQDQPVNVFTKHKDLSPEEREAGFVVVQAMQTTSAEDAAPFVKVLEKDLGELTSVIPAHTGYVPRVYANANFTVSVIDTTSGRVSRIAALSRQSEAVELARKRQATAEGNEIVVYHRWDENTGGMRVGVPRASIQVYDLLDNEAADKLKASLQGSGIEGADKIVAYFNRLDLGDMRNRFTGRRQDIPIGELAPTPQALADYFSATARNQSLGYWRDWATSQFKEQYKNILVPGLHWSDKNAIPNNVMSARVNNQRASLVSDDNLDAMLKDARLMQRALKRAVFGTTMHERWIKNFMDNRIAMGAASDSAVARATAKVVERMRFDGIGVARGIGAYSKLMFGNVAQIIVQGSQIAVTAGAHPVFATKAAAQLVPVTMAALARRYKPNLPLPREVEQTLNALRKSGYLSDVRTSDLANLAQTPSNPIPSAVGRMLQTPGNTAELISSAPFLIGEATNRAMAFLTVRAELTEQAKKGVLKGLDGTPFKGQIDDDEFLRLVTNKAKIFALNMGRSAQLELFSGGGSIVFQFKQVGFKFLNIFETKELTAGEKWRAAAGMLGLWGPTAVPFIPDLTLGADAVGRLFTDDPNQTELFTQNVLKLREFQEGMVDYLASYTPQELAEFGMDRAFYDRLTRKGFVNAMTQGDLDITNRVALGKFFVESLEGADPQDAVVFFSVFADVWDAASKAGLFSAANIYSFANAIGLYAAETSGAAPAGSYDKFIDQLRYADRDTGLIGGAFTAETKEQRTSAIIRLAKEGGQAISYLGSVARFFEDMSALNNAGTTPEIVDQTVPFSKTSTGKPTIPIDRTTLHQRIFGLTPGQEVEEFNKQKRERLYADRFENWINGQVDKFSATLDPVKQDRILQETLVNVRELDSTLQGWEIEGVLDSDWESQMLARFFNSLARPHSPIEERRLD